MRRDLAQQQDVPWADTQVLRTYLLAALLLLSALNQAASLGLPSPGTDRGVALVTIVIWSLGAALLIVAGTRLGRWAGPLMVALHSGLVTAIYASAPPTQNGHLTLYLWMIPYLYTFFGPRQIAAQTVLIIACASAVLVWHARVGGYPVTGAPALGTGFSFGATLLVMGLLTRRLTTALDRSRRQARSNAARASRQAARAQALADLTEGALVRADVGAVLADAAREAARILDVTIAVVLEGAPDSTWLRLTAQVGWPEGVAGDEAFPLSATTPVGLAYLTRGPVTTPLLPADERFAGFPPRLPGVLAWLAVPILTASRPGAVPAIEGVISVMSRQRRAFDEDDARFLGSIAAMIGAATARGRMERRLEHEALHDELTGLPNRTLYLDRLHAAIAHGARSGSDVAVLLVDLDEFKLVNDSLGHTVGDHLLVAVAQRLSDTLRASDTLARLGGDEFVVVVQDVQRPSDACVVAGHLRDALAAALDVDGHAFFVTMSIGIAFAAGRHDDPGKVLREADAAMYQAKARGRGHVEVYDEALRTQVTRRLQLETHLRRAVHGEALQVMYQSVVAPSSGEVAGVEALARWSSPALGAVGPDEFIPVAEDTGLIQALGESVIHQALDAAAQWLKIRPDMTVAVNVSPRQLHHRPFADCVRLLAESAGVPLTALHLEITEGVLLDRDENTLMNLRCLHEAGAHLSLDDFGTGYSSMSQLRRLPLSRLKVDRSLIDDDAILRAVADLARTLELVVVAEGVETPAQRDRLIDLRYPLAQGYLFSRPKTRDEITLDLELADHPRVRPPSRHHLGARR